MKCSVDCFGLCIGRDTKHFVVVFPGRRRHNLSSWQIGHVQETERLVEFAHNKTFISHFPLLAEVVVLAGATVCRVSLVARPW